MSNRSNETERLIEDTGLEHELEEAKITKLVPQIRGMRPLNMYRQLV